MIELLESRVMLSYTATLVNGVATLRYEGSENGTIRIVQSGDNLGHELVPEPVYDYFGFQNNLDFDSTVPGIQYLKNDAAFSLVIETAGARISVHPTAASRIKASVTVRGGPGKDHLTISDFSDSAADMILSANNLTFGSLVLTYEGLDSLLLVGNDLDNHFELDTTIGSISIQGSRGVNSARVTARPGVRVSYNGSLGEDHLTVLGTPGADHIRVGEFSGDAPATQTLVGGLVERLTILGLGGDDVIDGQLSAMPLSVEAGEGDDTVLGSGYGDSIAGGVGNDSVTGGDGADAIGGGDGADYLSGGTGVDVVLSDGHDSVDSGGDYEDELRVGGTDGDDAITIDQSHASGWAAVWVEMLGGNDLMTVLHVPANFSVDAGDGDDDILVENVAPTVTINGAGGNDRVTVHGTDGPDQVKIVLTWLNESGMGLENVEALTFDARGGDDLISIGVNPLPVTVLAGDGNDRVVVLHGVLGGTPGLTVDGGPGADSVTVSHGASGSVQVVVTDDAISSGGDSIGLVDVERLSVRASGGDDLIDASGRTLPATLSGGLGADTLIGGSGDDTIRGEDGGDSLVGGGGIDDIDGGAGADVVVGDGQDVLVPGAGAEDDLYLRGSDADDVMAVEAELVGRWRVVVVEGMGGNDVITVLQVPAGLSVEGGDGVDALVVMGTEGADSFVLHDRLINNGLVTFGGVEALTIDALGGDDYVRVVRHGLDTTVLGGAGDDVTRVLASGLSEKSLWVGGGDGVDQLQVSGTPGAEAFRVVPGAIRVGLLAVLHGEMDSLQVSGGEGNDVFTVKGQAAPVTISGSGGDDALTLRATNARPIKYSGGDGVDSVRYVGTEGDDVITVGRGKIIAAAFSTVLLYVEGVTVEGSGGDDVLDARNSEVGVTLIGGDGNDRLLGSAHADLLLGGRGEDTVVGGKGDVLSR